MQYATQRKTFNIKKKLLLKNFKVLYLVEVVGKYLNPRATTEIGLCVEIRCALKAAFRVKHPSPTIMIF